MDKIDKRPSVPGTKANKMLVLTAAQVAVVHKILEAVFLNGKYNEHTDPELFSEAHSVLDSDAWRRARKAQDEHLALVLDQLQVGEDEDDDVEAEYTGP